MSADISLPHNETRLNGKRIELATSQGLVIASSDVVVGAGRYNDAQGIGHCAVHLFDPAIGTRRVYIIKREAALNMAAGLARVANEAPA